MLDQDILIRSLTFMVGARCYVPLQDQAFGQAGKTRPE